MSLVINIFFAIVGLYGVFMGLTEYKFWNGMVPGGGFMPTIAGTILTVFAILMILDKNSRVDTKFDTKILLPIAALAFSIVGSYIVGMMVSLTIMMFLWLLVIEKYKWYKALIYSVITGAATYAMFGLWLKVPFPTGILGKLIS